MAIWFIFLRFGMLYQEKSGNPYPLCYLKKHMVRYLRLFAFFWLDYLNLIFSQKRCREKTRAYL
jgi:hypothetical protein